MPVVHVLMYCFTSQVHQAVKFVIICHYEPFSYVVDKSSKTSEPKYVRPFFPVHTLTVAAVKPCTWKSQAMAHLILGPLVRCTPKECCPHMTVKPHDKLKWLQLQLENFVSIYFIICKVTELI